MQQVTFANRNTTVELTKERTGIPPLLSQRNPFQGVKCLKWYVKNNYIYNVKERMSEKKLPSTIIHM